MERLSLKGNFGFAEFADPKSAAQAVKRKNLEGGIFLKKSNAPPKKSPPKNVVEATKENKEQKSAVKTEEKKEQPKENVKFDPTTMAKEWGAIDLGAMLKKANPN